MTARLARRPAPPPIPFRPHGYQTRAIRHALAKPRCALFVDMGLGKTVAALSAALADVIDGGRTLVIAPKKVAAETWPDEIAKWTHVSGLRVRVAAGTPRQRAAALLDESADIVTLGVDNLVAAVKLWGGRIPFARVIIDESSGFRDHGALRFKALVTGGAIFRVPFVLLLTATPTSGRFVDIWPQSFILDRGERLGRTVGAFREKFCVPAITDRRTGQVRRYRVRDEDAEREILAALSDICLTLRAEDYLDMPERRDVPHWLTTSDAVVRQAQKFARDAVVEFGGRVVTAVNAAVLAGKLRQFAAGAVYLDPEDPNDLRHWNGDRAFHLVHDVKIEALREIVEAATTPVLVMYWFQSDLARLREAFPEGREAREKDATRDWNEGRVPVMFAHPRNVGHGLNLQAGGSTLVWFSLPNFSSELFRQANGRLYRQGQTRPVVIHVLLVRDSADVHEWETIQADECGLERFLNALRFRPAA